MAGSITTKVYTTDDGVNYAIRIDESNAEAEIADFDSPCCENLTVSLPDLPRGLKPRYVLATLSGNKVVRRKFILGDTDGIESAVRPGASINGSYGHNSLGEPNAGVTWNITYYSGERRRISTRPDGDSGLIDGDND